METINFVHIIGNITKDIELKTTQGGSEVANFTVAVSRKYKNQNGERETDFIPVVVWKVLASLCNQYLKKGSKVGVSGSIQTRTYEDQNGNTRYVTEINASDVDFLTPKNESQGQQGNGYQQNQGYQPKTEGKYPVPPGQGSIQPKQEEIKGFNEFEISDEELPF